MKNVATLNEEDVKQIIRKHFELKHMRESNDKEVKNITINVNQRTVGYGLGEYTEAIFESVEVEIEEEYFG